MNLTDLAWTDVDKLSRDLPVVVPVAAALIFSLLYLTYNNIVDALRVFTGVPFGWVGGIFALWLRDMPFSISAAIGFIALSGVAVLDDMILVSYIRQLRSRGLSRDVAVRLAAVTPIHLSGHAQDAGIMFEFSPDARFEFLHPADAGTAFARAVKPTATSR